MRTIRKYEVLEKAARVANPISGRYGAWPSGTFSILYEKMADKNAEIGNNGDGTARRRYNEVMREFDMQLREVKKGDWDRAFRALSERRMEAAKTVLCPGSKPGEFGKAVLLFDRMETEISAKYDKFELAVKKKMPEIKMPRIRKIGPENIETALDELEEVARYIVK
ncbi:Uncharacterised protein [uncultured archaeon]|nr:Uncharacterised protein [uncultured archaeon]